MKKSRKLYKEKLNSIVQSNYVVIDLELYNRMVHQNSCLIERTNRIYRILSIDGMTIKQKYNAIKDIMYDK